MSLIHPRSSVTIRVTDRSVDRLQACPGSDSRSKMVLYIIAVEPEYDLDFYNTLDWTPRFRSDTEKKINQEYEKKNVTRLGFEPETCCVEFGYSNR